MKIHYIMIAMIIILAILFIGVKFYRPLEKKRNKSEVEYFEAVMKFKKNGGESDDAEKKGLVFYEALGKSSDEITFLINRDLKSSY